MTDPNKNKDFKFNFNFDLNSAGANNNTGANTNPSNTNQTNPSNPSQPFQFNFGNTATPAASAATNSGSKPFKFDFGSVNTGDQKDNPFLPVVTDKLNEMIGTTSGFIESLPPIVQYRIEYLRELAAESEELDRQMEAEIRTIELKYQELSRPIYLKRRQCVSGEVDPTLKPVSSTPSTSTTSSTTSSTTAAAEDPETPHKFASGRPENPEKIKGIPEFWLTTLKNCAMFEEAITPDDEEALKYLIDITAELLPSEPNSFRIDFHFSQNPFFSNSVLTKTYHMDPLDPNSPICESIDATKIEWLKNKDLVKKQVGEICEGGSFFMFFNPPNIPEEGEEEEGDVARVEMDFGMANTIRDMVPNALETYLGEVEGDDMMADIFGEGASLMEEEGDEDEAEDDDDEEEDDDYQPVRRARGGRGGRGGGGRGGRGGGRPPEECKQQ